MRASICDRSNAIVDPSGSCSSSALVSREAATTESKSPCQICHVLQGPLFLGRESITRALHVAHLVANTQGWVGCSLARNDPAAEKPSHVPVPYGDGQLSRVRRHARASASTDRRQQCFLADATQPLQQRNVHLLSGRRSSDALGPPAIAESWWQCRTIVNLAVAALGEQYRWRRRGSARRPPRGSKSSVCRRGAHAVYP